MRQVGRRDGTAAIAFVAACGGGSDAGAKATVRDSAGVRIVENHGPAWDEDDAWRLSPEPVVSIGAMDAEPEYQLFGVRAVARLSDGTIVVSNSGSHEIRWYDPSGRHLRSAGGEGSGPGEFTALGWLAALPGDSVVAFDDRLLRLSLFTPGGTFARSAAPQAEGKPGMERPVFLASMGDGSLLAFGRVLELEGMSEGPLLVPMVLYRFNVDGELLDSLGAFHGWETRVVIRRSEQFVAMAIADRPFARNTALTAGGDRYVVGTPHSYELAVHRSDGSLLAIVRLLRSNAAVTPADIEAYKSLMLENIDNENELRDRRQELDDYDYPAEAPASGSSILIDTQGHIWVPEYSVRNDQGMEWQVFDSEYRLLGTVMTPARFTPRYIGDDIVLGVWRDEFDVEYVRGYELISP
ncbi:MAG: hypothetical protein JSW71_01160 [Gemmatimonadota bacterium]|nr:MAG: hypothetical protein JSW71_01160 [Gemmatimonadota bacterium]